MYQSPDGQHVHSATRGLEKSVEAKGGTTELLIVKVTRKPVWHVP